MQPKQRTESNYKKPTALVYVAGHHKHERKNKLDACLRHANNHAGQGWLNQHGEISAEIQEAFETMEEEDDPVKYAESSTNFPLAQLWIVSDEGAPGPGRKGAINWCVDQDRKITLITPNVDHLVDKSAKADRLTRLLNGGVDVHLCEPGITLRRYTKVEGKTASLIRSLSESISGSVKTGDSYRHKGGRPPLGFKAVDGELIPDEDEDPTYTTVCNVLQQVKDGTRSRNKAAERLDCARATINNCLDRPDMYQLE